MDGCTGSLTDMQAVSRRYPLLRGRSASDAERGEAPRFQPGRTWPRACFGRWLGRFVIRVSLRPQILQSAGMCFGVNSWSAKLHVSALCGLPRHSPRHSICGKRTAVAWQWYIPSPKAHDRVKSDLSGVGASSLFGPRTPSTGEYSVGLVFRTCHRQPKSS